MKFTNKITVITGAGQGIGAGIAEFFAKKGSIVIIAEINPETGRAQEQKLVSQGYKASYIHTDVSKMDSINAMFDEVIEKYGKVDFLINNAGLGGGIRNSLELTKEKWDYTIAVNLTGVMYCSQRAANDMARRGFGRIIIITSAAGQTGGSSTGPDYAASKAAVITLAKYFSRDFAPKGITTNCIACGIIDSPLLDRVQPDILQRLQAGIPVGRIGTPEDVAETCAFLCSDGAAFISGQTIDLNGGAFTRA